MVENRPYRTILTHAILIMGIALIIFPIYVALVASTHHKKDIATTVQPWFGDNTFENYMTVLKTGKKTAGGVPVGLMMVNSLIMAVGIVVGKIAISLISAFAIVYFRFPLRMFFFWIIFMTLMLPIEVRILPTYKIVADLGLLNTYTGLTLPLIASATATFLFRQFFMTVPDELETPSQTTQQRRRAPANEPMVDRVISSACPSLYPATSVSPVRVTTMMRAESATRMNSALVATARSTET